MKKQKHLAPYQKKEQRQFKTQLRGCKAEHFCQDEALSRRKHFTAVDEAANIRISRDAWESQTLSNPYYDGEQED